MKRVVKLSEKSKEPVKCACIIVQDGKIIAEEFNSQRADNIAVHHAEVKAVYQASSKTGTRILKGAAAYCSCEPCVMCLSALSLANIERIVYCQRMSDISPGVPMANLDSEEFAKQYLNFTPKLEQLLL